MTHTAPSMEHPPAPLQVQPYLFPLALCDAFQFSLLQDTWVPSLTSTDSVPTTIHTEPIDIAPALCGCDLQGVCMFPNFPSRLSSSPG